MLVKYYGLIPDQNGISHSPRTEFLSDGLFRVTQPVYLNDKGSETKLYPYFNKFSPADFAWAKREATKSKGVPPTPLSNEDLERLFLKPMGIRYGKAFPHLRVLEDEYSSIEEYDEAEFVRVVQLINHTLIQVLSCQAGVLSLAKSDVNELMWTHYASEGKGIAISFKEGHPFFQKNRPKDIDYNPEGRATFTYYEGSMRINGEPIDTFKVGSDGDQHKILFEIFSKGIDIQDMSDRLFYSKEEKWRYEDEARIIFGLSSTDKKFGNDFEPDIDSKVKEIMSNLFQYNPEVCLKEIPFDAFESLTFGYSIDEKVKENIIRKVDENSELKHLKIKQVKHNIYGELQAEDISVSV